jgi:hypothetical protein
MLPLSSYPPLEVAMQFCADSMFHPDPVGIHKPWDWRTLEEELVLLSNIPGATLLA